MPDLDNIRNPVQIDPSRVLDRISVPDSEPDDSFIDPDQMTKKGPARDAPRKREPTPKPSGFAISLAAYIQAPAGTCPLYGHREEQEVNNKEESDFN
jgi:hypothetical protein